MQVCFCNFENKFIKNFYLVMSHSENFVGHTSVQEVFDVIWNGKTAHKVIYIYILWKINDCIL